MASKQFAEALRRAAVRVNADAQVLKYYNDPVLWAEERAGLILWSKQKEILTSLANNKRTAVKSCHSIGKDLPLDTPIPTPTGWTTMGDLEPGDLVIGIVENTFIQGVYLGGNVTQLVSYNLINQIEF